MTALVARRALVTGGGGGIGSAICRRLAYAGHHVYVHALSSQGVAEALVQELKEQKLCAETVRFDVTEAASTRAALDKLLEHGPMQILVNNAAIHDDAVFPAMVDAQWRRVIDVSLHGFYHVTQALLLPMIRTRWGRIINVTSVAALKGNRGQVNYAAAKGAVNSATKALALEVATRGITVNAVAPGIIATPMTEGRFDANAIARLVPMERAGSAPEIAGVVAFLSSEEASYITGQIISVNGGMY